MPRGLVLGFDKATRRPVYMDDATRATSLHIVGAPGTGKTKLIENLIRADIRAGKGVCLLDPHGHLFDNIVRWCEYVGAHSS
jgi:KaiC/GvpD/RAD55 family RecA-like ATPase